MSLGEPTEPPERGIVKQRLHDSPEFGVVMVGHTAAPCALEVEGVVVEHRPCRKPVRRPDECSVAIVSFKDDTDRPSSDGKEGMNL